ncbi:GNAT family N-acetyltransferase [Salipiger sp.]|uniref:GNAT family N-acetyltransferase n=1 Tax=Salipiger sp. TaxID=2078585 RepID=UPI003A986D8C
MIPRQTDQDAGAAGGILLSRGRLRARLAADARDVAAAQALRGLAFFGPGGRADRDAHDDLCDHVLIEAAEEEAPVACFRCLWLPDGAALGRSYAARFYDLDRLSALDGPLLELGRFCVRPGLTDPDVLRIAWGAITALVDARAGRMLFGCVSFRGTDPAPYGDALARLGAHHAAPERRRIGVKAPEVVRLGPGPGDGRAAMKQMPPLLRTYLSMGGWVSDHAVVDREMNTLHVFTGVETAAIPPARARALRAIAS